MRRASATWCRAAHVRVAASCRRPPRCDVLRYIATTTTTTTTQPPPPLQQQTKATMSAVHIDAARLPRTIPGMTQEELAARLSSYYTQHASSTHRSNNNDNKSSGSSSATAKRDTPSHGEDVASLSAEEQYWQQQRHRRRQLWRQWCRLALYALFAIGTTYFVFAFFLFFNRDRGNGSMRRARVSLALACATRVRLLRLHGIKSDPMQTEAGQFDKSFEKLTGTIASRLPTMTGHVPAHVMRDAPFGEGDEDDAQTQQPADDAGARAASSPPASSAMSQQQQQRRQQQQQQSSYQRHGAREPPAAALHARSFFADEDMTPEAQHTRSPRLKAAQARVRAAYDKTLLKSSHEPADYYYPTYTRAQQRRRHAVLALAWAAVLAVVFAGTRKLLHYMRYAG